MKKTMFLLSGVLMGLTTIAQVNTPQLSPAAEIKQTVGLTTFEVEYARPSLRGRDMYKEIVPVDQPWRFGANKNSTLSFDTPINFGGVEVEEGTYAIYAVPNQKEWLITLYNETENWGLPKKWDEDKVVAEVKVPVKTSKETIETFTISLENLDVNHFDLTILWENTILPIHVQLPTKDLTVASINEIMSGTPTERDYYRSATYYLHEKIELESALEYVNKAIEINGDAPMYYIYNKALILGSMGKNKEAVEAAEQSLKMAKKAGSKEYVLKSEEAVKKWSK